MNPLIGTISKAFRLMEGGMKRSGGNTTGLTISVLAELEAGKGSVRNCCKSKG